MTAKQVVPQAILDEAKKLYMEYMPVKTISVQLGVPRTTLNYHANKYWDFERNLSRAEMFKNFSDQKKVVMTNMSESALKIMTRAMEATADSDTPPTLHMASQCATILESIDKILRLDDNKPTDITESRPVTLKDLKKRLSVDPFSEVEYIEDVRPDPTDVENEDD